MGLRDWVLGENEDRLEEANQLRGVALEAPREVDAGRLVELYLEAGQADVARNAAKGIEILARQRPSQLADHVPDLLEATQEVESVRGAERGQIATAIEHIAAEYPYEVETCSSLLVESLSRELKAENAPGNDVRLYPEKAAALAGAAARADVTDAEPVLKKLRRYHDPTVSDAARDALKEL